MQQRVRRSVARKAAVVVCLALLGVTACHGANVQQGDRDYPRTNPAPTRFLLLHGTIDPALDIDFRIEWSARSSKCRFATSRIEGAYANYTSWSALQVARRGSAFSVRVPIDAVLPGRCDWSFGGVTLGGRTGYRTALIATNSPPLEPGQSPNGVVELRCKSQPVANSPSAEQALDCRWPKHEDPNASVRGGILWWHPETTDVEAHIMAE